jgi:starch synthase (maltosyl-transferring)
VTVPTNPRGMAEVSGRAETSFKPRVLNARISVSWGLLRSRGDRSADLTNLPDGRKRVAVENLTPEVGGGRFPIRRIAGDSVQVRADIFADGTDAITAFLEFRRAGTRPWSRVPMQPGDNDRWTGRFAVPEMGAYEYRVKAWIDPIGSWLEDLRKRTRGGQSGAQEVGDGIGMLRKAADSARGSIARKLQAWADELEQTLQTDPAAAVTRALAVAPGELSIEPEAARVTIERPDLRVTVDPKEAGASAWYELFPRSTSDTPGRSGTFADVERWLPYIAGLGFDVVYLAPIHPIGQTHRRGPNNTPNADPGDPGSPWAIGSPEGGHTAIHPELGTFEDFQRLLVTARSLGLDVALDLAFQCSPDHPWVIEHPTWFRHRSDGSIRPAENPPKKYDDIYPFDFDSEAWPELWEALREVVEFWVDQGIRRFRVDNPHTKPFSFWEWLIATVRAKHPDVMFLAEAFTRPKVMYQLAKVGFTHSYTYFAWRNTKPELTTYFQELNGPDLREYFRPHLWPNTPDILTEYLQHGGRPAFLTRLILAATLSPNYGIYGPAFELTEARALVPGQEEYLDSEKYQIRSWDPTSPDSIASVVTRINGIRHEHRALREAGVLMFQGVDNDQILAYSRSAEDGSDPLLVFVNLDPKRVQAGWTDLDVAALGLGPDQPYEVHDLLSDGRWLWQGRRNFVELRPQEMPAHVLTLAPKGGRS